MKRLLVANRGEIAVRIVRAARELGIETIAVASEADLDALHTRVADRCEPIGPAEASESYLSIDRILEAATHAGADGVHPGYGFLAENADFAEAVEAAGLTWVGPPAEAMRLMGDKLAARAAVEPRGVPVPPAAQGDTTAELIESADAIGLPVLVKATAGGGGKGMRVVRNPDELGEAIEEAARIARSTFGNDTVYLERFLEGCRHVEIQILADAHGNTIHLGERECSIQRRHQKLVEECPSVAVDADLRERMGRAAVEVARAASYVGAGTVEFLLDPEGNFHFLEMNTRIQVEHPVTEMVTGIDLVAWQLRIASGEPLDITQEEIRSRGHAIECRLYAEDPARDFTPSPGRIGLWRTPQGPGVRLDSGVSEGSEVPVHYDPILAKLVVWGPDRESCRRRTLTALSETIVLGVSTTVSFLQDVLAHPSFVAGETTTDFLATHMDGWPQSTGESSCDEDQILAAAMAAVSERWRRTRETDTGTSGSDRPANPWGSLGRWRIGEIS